MPKLKKEIIDMLEVTEVKRSTGEVCTYTKPVYDKEIHEENKRLILSEKELHQYINEEIGNFYFLFYKKLEDVDMQDQFKLRFIYLSSFIDYNYGDLVEKQGREKIKLSFDGIRTLLNLSCSETRKTIKAFIENGLIEKNNTYYTMSTEYCIKGVNKKVKNNCTRVFIDTIRNIYENTKSTNHKQLYMFFKLLPFVNVQYNVITNNIHAEIHGDIIPLNMKEISSILGIDKSNSSKLYKNLQKFMIGDEFTICKHEINKMEAYSINPRLYYMGTDIDKLKGIQLLFDIAKEINSKSSNLVKTDCK